MSERIFASYWLETPLEPAAAAAAMAGEQSTGTFVAVPGETPEIHERHAARVEHVRPLAAVDAPSLPGARGGSATERPRYNCAEVELSWPIENLGPSLTTLMATIAGNLFELSQLSGLRLRDIRLPPAFAAAYPGPQFGVAGTRRLAGVEEDRPLIGTIIKPSVGLSPAATAALVRELCEAGIDFIKDDELQADGPHCPFDARVEAVMAVVNEHAERTGKKVMFAFNVTGELDAMRRHHDTVLAHGGTCIMVSLLACGPVGFVALRRHAALPIHAHRNGWGYLSRHPALGFDYVAWQKLWRLAGADHMHVNGMANKFSEDDASVIRSAKACLSPMFAPPARGYEVMPVFSSGQWAGTAFPTFAALGSTDLIFAAGGGIVAHPDGPRAGVASIRQAWAAAQAGERLEYAARTYPELARAVEAFG